MQPRTRRPPRLTLRPVTDLGTVRHASWLELFFDLIFVLVVSQVAVELHDEPTVQGFLSFTFLFALLWWAWVGYTFYADRFEADCDVVYRLMMLGGMLAVAAMAVNAHGAFHGRAIPFAISYILVRAVLILLYIRAWRHVHMARELASRYIAAFAGGMIFWIASLFLPAGARIWLWSAGFLVELVTPLVNTRVVLRTPYDTSHIPERFGLFTIIVLGEAVIGATIGLNGTEWRITSSAAAAGAFMVVAALWWIYFEFMEAETLQQWRVAGQTYLYAHLPVVLGLTMLGAGGRNIAREAIAGVMTSGTRWTVCGGVALYLVALSIIGIASKRGKLAAPRLAAAAVALLTAIFGEGLGPIPIEGILLAALIGQIVLETRAGHARRRDAALDVPREPDTEERALTSFATIAGTTCTHLDMIHEVTPSADGCQECIALGEDWVEARICLTCGHVGCCDTSKHRHAARHFQETGHPLMETFEPGPKWRWCYVDETYLPGGVSR